MNNFKSKSELTEHSALGDVLNHFSSKAGLAKTLGISRQRVSQMDISRPLPRLHFLLLRYEKRPDLYAPCRGDDK